jgi:DNA processing protein
VDDRRLPWVALNCVLGECPHLLKRLVERYQPLSLAFEAGAAELRLLGLDEKSAQAIASSRALELAGEELRQAAKKNYAVLIAGDKEYPEYLREIFEPPLVLYCAGSVEVLNEAAVAIVGARQPTPYGSAVAEKLAFDLASRGLAIVSGLARGIDSIAHWGAIKGGTTIAVLGSGLENMYPRENRSLFNKIIERGAVVTEYPLSSAPLGYHFPLRNRILSGLALATVVVEATSRSGSLITAQFALEQNRGVLAVPGNITSELSRGTNWLIQNGAGLVRDWMDVAQDLPSPLRETLLAQKQENEAPRPKLSPEDDKILSCLKTDSLVHIDEVVERTGRSVSELLARLLGWELEGWIVQRPGKFFQRRI